MEDNHWDPIVSMPIPLPISHSIPNDDSIQKDAADHSQPAPVEPNYPNLSSSQEPQIPVEPMEIDLGEDLGSEKHMKVYSRRGKHPTPQLGQLLE